MQIPVSSVFLGLGSLDVAILHLVTSNGELIITFDQTIKESAEAVHATATNMNDCPHHV